MIVAPRGCRVARPIAMSTQGGGKLVIDVFQRRHFIRPRYERRTCTQTRSLCTCIIHKNIPNQGCREAQMKLTASVCETNCAWLYLNESRQSAHGIDEEEHILTTLSMRTSNTWIGLPRVAARLTKSLRRQGEEKLVLNISQQSHASSSCYWKSSTYTTMALCWTWYTRLGLLKGAGDLR